MPTKTSPMQQVMLDENSHLGQLIHKARALKSLNASFAELVGDLANHCSVEHFADGVLEVTAFNASIATRLRFLEPKILQTLRSNPNWIGLRSIKVNTNPT